IPACFEDDDDYNFAITPNEPVDSLIMRDEHLDTVLATESDDFIKSSVENLVPNPIESEGENESFQFDIPSFSHPPAKPLDGNTEILNVKMMDDISDQKVPMITFVPNQEKSPDLLSHQGLEIFQPSAECPMMIYGKNTPILDVLLFHFYPLDQLKYKGN
nr:hypothetical protein [Tanacetum cinerariifolium]